MDKKLYSPVALTYRPIIEPAKEIVTYIDNRRKGKIFSLKTRWKKYNNACMGGIEPNTVVTFGGISGSGKTALVGQIENDIIDLNPWADIVVLSFNFEMLSSKQVGRKLSSKLNKTTSELYSGIMGSNLSDSDYAKVIEEAKKLSKYPIYYVDTPGTVQEISYTIQQFVREPYAKGKWLIIILDHVLLTKGKSGEDEKRTISDLQKLFMEVKKHGLNTIIQVAQMNRQIETTERINNPSNHFPMRSDIFGSDTIFQASDYINIIHRPELLNLTTYGVKSLPVKDKVYMHILKNREGNPVILSFDNKLQFSRIEEETLKLIQE